MKRTFLLCQSSYECSCKMNFELTKSDNKNNNRSKNNMENYQALTIGELKHSPAVAVFFFSRPLGLEIKVVR